MQNRKDKAQVGRIKAKWEKHRPDRKDKGPDEKDSSHMERTQARWEGHKPDGKDTSQIGRTAKDCTDIVKYIDLYRTVPDI